MRSAICTLFDGPYHFGVGALINSLHRSGFTGPLFAGYRGALPPWAAGRCTPGPDGAQQLQAGSVEVHLLPVATPLNLTNYKPGFMLHLWEQRAPSAERMFFFDADTLTVAPWAFFENWADAGVAVVADGNTPLPVNHPLRVAWRRHFEPHGFRFTPRHDYHFNGGFIGLHRDRRATLEAWVKVLEIMAASVPLDLPIGLSGAPAEQRSRLFPFYLTDQDALNIVTDLAEAVVAPIGSEGMGWKEPAIYLLHACLHPKPWTGEYLRTARRGRAPGSIDEAYWSCVETPLALFPPGHVAKMRQRMKWSRLLAPLGGWAAAVPRMISVCIPTFHAARFLPEALASVRAQTHAEWELIVTEDGSSDGTEEIVAEFARTVAQPVHFHRHEQNRGLPATRNSGLRQARGESVALLDADDHWAAEHLADLVAKQAESRVEVVHAGSILFDSESGRTLELRAPSAEAVRTFPRSLFLAEYVIQPASVLLSKALWERVGGFGESFRYVEDREMWLRCARAGARFAFTGKNTCFYRKHAAALSTHAAEMAVASARVFEQHLDWAEIPADLRVRCATETWEAAARILQRAEPRRASEYLLRAQKIAPRFDRLLRASALRLYALAKG